MVDILRSFDRRRNQEDAASNHCEQRQRQSVPQSSPGGPVDQYVERLYPAEAYVSVNGVRNKAMADQIATASKQRLRNKIGQLVSADLTGVERAIKIQLGLS